MFDNTPPDKGWTKTEIAESCDLSKHGGAAGHIRGLVALDLLSEDEGRYWPGRIDSALFIRVAALVDELERVPDRRIDELLEEKGG